MSLILGDGFDHYNTALLSSKWDYVRGGSNSVIDPAYARRFQGIKLNGTYQTIGQGGVGKNLPTNNTGWGFFGQAIKIPTMPGEGVTVLNAVYDLVGGGAMHIASLIGADGSLHCGVIYVSNFSTTFALFASASPGTIVANTSAYVETGVKVNNVNGGMIIKVNGIEKINYVGNTRQGGGNGAGVSSANYFNHVRLGGGASVAGSGWNYSTEMYLDDFYYCDDAGSINNTFLGDVTLEAIYPDGVGSSAAWTPIGVVNNWDAVNEAVPDDNTTYNKSQTINALDMHTMQDISATSADIKGLLCNARLYKDDATTRTYALQVQTGASPIVELATRAAPGSYVNQQDVSEVSPASGTFWTPAEVNAMQHGTKVKS